MCERDKVASSAVLRQENQVVTDAVAMDHDPRRSDMDRLRAHLMAHSSETTTSLAAPPSNNKSGVNPAVSRGTTGMLVRCILLDLPLMLLFGLFLSLSVLQWIRQEYWLPILERAVRTDEDLKNEFTYYERICDPVDISTRDPQDLVVTNASAVMDTMMIHGAMFLPNLLSLPRVEELRDYIVTRNDNIAEEQIIPVSQGKNRLSYGLDATEHPAVTRAIQEVASNPLLMASLQQILGDFDPAVTEITAITAYYKAPDQVWHADVKQDGNAYLYARTYTHSYSLFIPLQDTTAAMGMTQICPGTHYCGNDLEQVCDQFKLPQDQVWKAGDAALLNQQVWHRGTRHRDPNAKERIVFIMSFLARPRDLTRQLSRGTYFHMRWNMWGFTFQDLWDADVSMSMPFSVLRCLGIWKPFNRNWGYDWVTAALLRMANEQLGMTPEELPDLVMAADILRIPKWLQGRILLETEGAWKIYIRETLENLYDFFFATNCVVHGVYMLLTLLVFCLERHRGTARSILRSAFVRLCATHLLMAALAYYARNRIETSQWGQSVTQGHLLMRPFPDQSDSLSIPSGPTTMPERLDVLVGTRFDEALLGSYNHWLEYHPGNKKFREIARLYAPLYVSYQGLDQFFSTRLVEHIVEQVEGWNGRYLLQDYRNGDWQVMSRDDAVAFSRTQFMLMSNGILAALKQELDAMVAKYRFGASRQTRMALESQRYVFELEELLFGATRSLHPAAPSSRKTVSFRPAASSWTGIIQLRRETADWVTMRKSRWTTLPEEETPTVHAGNSVLCFFEDEGESGLYFPGSVLRVHENDFYDIAFDDGSVETFVPKDFVSLRVPVTEGSRVEADYQRQGETFPGTVTRVLPDGGINVQYDDGDVENGCYLYSILDDTSVV